MRSSMRRWTVLGLLLACAPDARTENFEHPGLVFVGKDGWVTPAQAAAKGYVQYQRRWVTKAAQRRLVAWEAKDEGWNSAKSEHYTVDAHVPRFILETEIVPFLDALHESYTAIFRDDFGIAQKGKDKRNYITIYGGYEEYTTEMIDPTTGKPRPRGGIYITKGKGVGGIVTYYEDTDPAELYATLFQLGAFRWLAGFYSAGTEVPSWVTEGISAYSQGCSYSPSTHTVALDHLPPDQLYEAQKRLAESARLPREKYPDELFNITSEDFGPTEKALAWSFLHYVVHNPDPAMRKDLGNYLRSMSSTGALSAYTGRYRGDATAWRQYVATLKPPEEPTWVRLSPPPGSPAAGVLDGDVVRDVDGVEVGGIVAFQDLWAQRPKDRPTVLTVIRRAANVPPWVGKDRGFVSLEIPADFAGDLAPGPGDLRRLSLRD